MAKEIYWHLPGFCYFFYLNQVIINLMHDYPDKFVEGYKVGSVYGTFPGAIWNGGRAVLGITSKSDMAKMIETYNKQDVPVRFTWTNSAIEREHVYDTYCNLIMRLADNGKNQVLVNSDILEDYLRNKYPNYKYISSTTKRILDLEDFRKELSKDYFMVVLDYDLNHNEEVVNSLVDVSDRVEILVDEICYPNCPKRKNHYLEESRMQLEFDKGEPFDCPNRKTKPTFSECMKRPAFISKEELSKYIEKGFCNFKLVGRGLPIEMVKESYLYYLVKDEEREFIQRKMDAILSKLPGGRR